eukprot:TRINITY_DN6824_c0_g1_i1.p1 TRINITY_DN6824_c0_g1~~TRINITY_DN6824_c0_g1_i1.p1  ORF type:complete len:687 (+),score=54.35 TRINITY_DN6824_c0_g1_i1:223-2061(+)
MGNDFFKDHDWDAAIHSYNWGIACAPTNSPTLSLCYANRSAVLSEMCMPNPCITQINKSIELKYPTEKLHKLYERRAKQYLLLGMKDKATADLQFILNGLSKYMNKQEIANINKKLLSVESYKPPVPTDFHTEYHDLDTCEIQKIHLEKNDVEGRYWVASEDIAPGTPVINSEKCISFGLYKELENPVITRCTFCLKPLVEDFLPCERCTYSFYCSNKCKLNHTEMHKFECGRSFEHNAPPQVQAALRLIRNQRVLSKTRPKYYSDDTIRVVSEFLGDDCYRWCDALETHDIDDRRILTRILNDCAFTYYALNESKPRDNPKITLPELLKAFIMIETNVFTVARTEDHGTFFDTEGARNLNFCRFGMGVYPVCSLLNHSCYPNCIIDWAQDSINLSIRATRRIPKGTKITISYGPQCATTTSVFERRRGLQSKFFFNCNCEVCVEDEKFIRNGDLDSLPFDYKKLNELDMELREMLKCKCEVEHDSLRTRCEKFAKIGEEMFKTLKLSKKEVIEKKKVLQPHIRRLLKFLVDVHDRISFTYSKMDKFSLSTKHMLSSLDYLEYLSFEYDIDLGVIYEKIQMNYSCYDPVKEKESRKRYEDFFMVLYGRRHYC